MWPMQIYSADGLFVWHSFVLRLHSLSKFSWRIYIVEKICKYSHMYISYTVKECTLAFDFFRSWIDSILFYQIPYIFNVQVTNCSLGFVKKSFFQKYLPGFFLWTLFNYLLLWRLNNMIILQFLFFSASFFSEDRFFASFLSSRSRRFRIFLRFFVCFRFFFVFLPVIEDEI